VTDVPIIFVPRSPYTDRTNVFVPIIPLALKALAVMGVEWTTLKFIEDAPLIVRISTFLASVFMLAVLEKREWLRFKGRSYFSITVTSITLIYIAIVGYSYSKYESAHPIATTIPSRQLNTQAARRLPSQDLSLLMLN
jgi:hypothetical protein